jgi:gluconolactonase
MGQTVLPSRRTAELLFAEGGGKRISKRGKDGTITTLTEGAPGIPLLAPNDLIMDAKGGIYFTDPGPRPVVPGRTMHVFYLPAGAKAPIVIDARNPRPNGLVHSKTLIVDDTLGVIVWPFDIEPDGTGTNKRVFATLRGIPTDHESGADGMAIDSDDRVYVTTAAGSRSSTRKACFSV